jgi:uncharacterized protein YjdB
MRCAALPAAVAFLGLTAGACNDPSRPGDVAVQGVKLSPQVIQFAAIGDTARLLATVAPANATDQTVSWESTDSTVASVDPAGLVTAQGIGTGVFITVVTHDGGHESSANVSVNP